MSLNAVTIMETIDSPTNWMMGTMFSKNHRNFVTHSMTTESIPPNVAVVAPKMFV